MRQQASTLFLTVMFVVSSLLVLAVSSEVTYATSTSDAVGQTHPALTWHRLADMPEGVFSAASSRQGRKLILTGGINQSGEASPLIQVLDLDTLAWQTAPAKLPAGTSYHTQVTLSDGSILIAGGRTGNLLSRLPASRATWRIAADLASVSPGPDLPGPATDLTSHLMPNGQAILIADAHALVYDPSSNAFIHRIKLRESRREHASTLLPDGRIFIAGGISRRTFEVVDPARRLSTMLAPRLPRPTDDLAAVTLPNGQVMILGGQDSHTGNTTSQCHVVDLSDPARATMQDTQGLGIAKGAADLAVTQLGSWIIAAGGESQRDGTDTELAIARIIDARTRKVWALPDMIVAHDDAQIVADGNAIIVIGGYAVSQLRIGPLQTQMPTAVHIVERLFLPEDRLTKHDSAPLTTR